MQKNLFKMLLIPCLQFSFSHLAVDVDQNRKISNFAKKKKNKNFLATITVKKKILLKL